MVSRVVMTLSPHICRAPPADWAYRPRKMSTGAHAWLDGRGYASDVRGTSHPSWGLQRWPAGGQGRLAGRLILYHRGPRSCRGRRGRSSPSRWRASLTVKVRPPSDVPLSPSMAAWAWVASGISTKPKPRDRPVYRSVLIWTLVISPYG